jgi:hypothetical protein
MDGQTVAPRTCERSRLFLLTEGTKTRERLFAHKKEMSILPPWLLEDTENVQPQEDLHEEQDVRTQDVEPICLKQDLEGIRDTLLELVDLVEDLLDTLTPLTMDCTK